MRLLLSARIFTGRPFSSSQHGPCAVQPNRKGKMRFPRERRAGHSKMEMELEPWEGLDIDDSDPSTFLRPCNRHHSKTDSPPLIPGPAGAVQAAMMQRRTSADPLPTQEFVRRVVQNGHDSDRDFNSNPWLSALHFVTGVADGDAVASATPLSSIQKHLNVGRVVAVVKSCTPNGFGDMVVTLKDPTGTVGASVHRKVFTEGEFGKDISVGSVLVLQKVAVFSPNPATCYLNITLRNIVKVFSKDSGPPSQQICPARSVKRTAPSIERHEKLWMPGSTLQDRTQGIMANLGLDSRLGQVADNGIDEILVLTGCHSDNGNDPNQKTVSDQENLSPRQDNAGPVEVTCGGELESEMEDQNQANPPKLGEGDNLAGFAQGNSSSTNSIHIAVGQETGVGKLLERQKETVNPKSSIPHWTEEQLDELLAFD